MKPARRPSDEAVLKGGLATLKKFGVDHYRRMGRLSAEKRRQNREVLRQRSQAISTIAEKFDVPPLNPLGRK